MSIVRLVLLAMAVLVVVIVVRTLLRTPRR
jgi:hypothetical protein